MLTLELQECRRWVQSDLAPVQLFADARGSPARVAAVLFVDGETLFCDLAPEQAVLDCFRKRKDNQIMSLELLSIALGLSSFEPWLKSRKVHVWSDNTGAEASTSRGSARSFDHTCLVHAIWLQAAKLGIDMRVDRVPTEDNIADLPSREDYVLLQKLGAVAVDAKLDAMFCCPEAWESLTAMGKSSTLMCARFACSRAPCTLVFAIH